MPMKAKILVQLKKIHDLESSVEERIINGLMPIQDETGRSLTPDNIQRRIEILADQLIADSLVSDPILISIMDGALPFASALQTILQTRDYRFQYTTIQVSSYHGTTSGLLTIKSPPKIAVGGRHVIIVDDVCDTGKTYHALRQLLLDQGASAVTLMVLVDKAQPRDNPESNPTYVGVTVSKDAFIAGMGMDYDGLLRNVPGIWAVDLSTLPTHEERLTLDLKDGLNTQLQVCIAAEKQVSLSASRDVFFAQPMLDATLAVVSLNTPYQSATS